jgi:hypothetical protein
MEQTNELSLFRHHAGMEDKIHLNQAVRIILIASTAVWFVLTALTAVWFVLTALTATTVGSILATETVVCEVTGGILLTTVIGTFFDAPLQVWALIWTILTEPIAWSRETHVVTTTGYEVSGTTTGYGVTGGILPFHHGHRDILRRSLQASIAVFCNSVVPAAAFTSVRHAHWINTPKGGAEYAPEVLLPGTSTPKLLYQTS